MAYCGYKVIASVPVGRRRYMEVLVPLLLRFRPLVDECHFWVNTSAPDDLACIHGLVREFADFVKFLPPKAEGPSGHIYNISQFYAYCQDSDALYVVLGDDSVWFDPNFFESLLAERVAHRDPILVHSNVVNTPLCSHLHRRVGQLRTPRFNFTYDPFSKDGWDNPAAAAYIHTEFLTSVAANTTDRFKFSRHELCTYERCCTTGTALFGSDYPIFEGIVSVLGSQEEYFRELSKKTGRCNVICGTALMVHFSFYTQRKVLEAKYPHLFEQYRKLALSGVAP